MNAQNGYMTPIDLDDRIRVAREVLNLQDPGGFAEDFLNNTSFNIGLLYAYLRCFVRLAYLGDVSRVAKEIDTTRQTVARQIHELENLLGTRLFEKIGASSRITERGLLWLPRAEEIFDLAGAFLVPRSSSPVDYRCVQLPIRMLSSADGGPGLLQRGLSAWKSGTQRKDCNHFSDLKDHWIVYGRDSGGWMAEEIGENSAFCQWFGKQAGIDGVGQEVPKVSGGRDLRNELSFVLDGLYTRGGVHYSEISCRLERGRPEEREPVRYFRLLMEMEGDQGEPVIGSLIQIASPLE